MDLGHEFYMREALKEARKAFEDDEVPVGAVVVANERIIARAYNQTERLNDVTAHAEMLAVTAAANAVGSKYLEECTVYVTLEPCTMCAAALNWSRVSTVVYGATDHKFGYHQFSPEIFNKKTTLLSGVLASECALLLSDFFQHKRNLGKLE